MGEKPKSSGLKKMFTCEMVIQHAQNWIELVTIFDRSARVSETFHYRSNEFFRPLEELACSVSLFPP
jgi:hypothetical protein